MELIHFDFSTIHKYGDLFYQMLKLRHKGFIVEQKYDVYDYEGLEFDQYDNPFVKYIVAIVNGKAVACTRLGRTDISYMAKDIWGEQIPSKHLPSSKNIYELTRLYVDSIMPNIDRTKIMRVILGYTYCCAALMGAKAFYFVTTQSLINALIKLTIDTHAVCDIVIEGYENQKYCIANIGKHNVQHVKDAISSIAETIKWCKTENILKNLDF